MQTSSAFLLLLDVKSISPHNPPPSNSPELHATSCEYESLESVKQAVEGVRAGSSARTSGPSPASSRKVILDAERIDLRSEPPSYYPHKLIDLCNLFLVRDPGVS
jgi:hypothetical protein